MASWKGKTRGGVLGYKIFIFVLRRLGLAPAYLLLRFVAVYFVFFSPAAVKAIRYYYKEILGFSSIKAWIGVYKNYYVFGQSLIDKVAIMSGMKDRFTYEFEGEHNLREMAATTGGLLIGAHLGNWEIAGNLLNRLDTKFNIVMFDEEHERIKSMLSDVLTEKKVHVIALKEDMSHIFEISKALSNKELICFHGDRFIQGSKTVTCNFMGRDAEFPTGPFYLATRFKVPCTFVYGMKETNSHYHLSSTTAKVYTGDVGPVVKEYVAQLEKMVKRYPYQWFNYYDFWGAYKNNNNR